MEIKMNYFKYHIGDYAMATAHLSWEEDLAYTRLLRAYYSSEKAIPSGKNAANRLIRAKTKKQRDAVQTVLEEYFILCDDGWHQKRCDEEIAGFQEKSNKAKESANARWQQEKQESGRNANAMRTQCEGNANHKPLTTNHKPVTNNHKPLTNKKRITGRSAPVAQTKTSDLWEAYAEAYSVRYGVDPIRNAKVNGQLAKFVDRIGRSEAPFVAAHYVTSNNSWYVKRGHSVDDLLKDAEKLRTEWATNCQVTDRKARELDRRTQDADEWNRLISEAQQHAAQ